jgi:hypothetical protein
VLGAMLLALAGCAATPYQPVNAQGYGYAEQPAADGGYIVVFVANTATSEQRARDFALLRAAELGADLGYGYIKVMNSRSGAVMLAPQRRPTDSSAVPDIQPTRAMSSNMMGSMGRGYGGSNGGGYGSGMTLPSSSPGGDPARAGVVMVRFGDQDTAGTGLQPIAPLLARLRAEYGLAAAGGR